MKIYLVIIKVEKLLFYWALKQIISDLSPIKILVKKKIKWEYKKKLKNASYKFIAINEKQLLKPV